MASPLPPRIDTRQVTEPPRLTARKTLFHGLRSRIMAVAMIPLLLASSLLAVYFVHREIAAGWAALDERGSEVAQRLAESAAFDLAAGNDDYLKRLLDYERVAQDCIALGIADRPGHWRLVSGQAGILPVPVAAARPLVWRSTGLAFFRYPVSLQKRAENDPYLADGQQTKVTLGEVLVVLSTRPIEQARQHILLATLGFTSILLLAAGALAWRLGQTLTRPLHAVIAAVRGVASGDLSIRVSESAQGELGELERGVNQMAEVIARHAEDMSQRIEEATRELRSQKLAAEAAVKARSRFLAAASHDLRQPMQALILLVEALKETLRGAGGEPLRLTEFINASAHAMESLLNALLDISKLNAGVVVARPECFAVDRVFQHLVRQYGPLAAEKGIQLRVHGTAATLFSDPVLVERILGNLLANAIRYTDQGRVILGLRRVQQDWALIEVWDSGKGIAEAFQERIFEEYFQLENPERGRDKGLGLGLAIVQRLARLLGSPVVVHSTLGKGSCFSIRLTRCEPPTSQEEITPPREEAVVARNGLPPLVAFIDDDETILEAMTLVFDQWGIDLAVGFDVNQIKADLEELGRKPDAILTDYRLRDGRTGVEAIAELRAAFGPAIPAVLLTGDTAATTIQAISNSGLPVLHKPLQPARLRAYLNHMLTGYQEPAPD